MNCVLCGSPEIGGRLKFHVGNRISAKLTVSLCGNCFVQTIGQFLQAKLACEKAQAVEVPSVDTSDAQEVRGLLTKGVDEVVSTVSDGDNQTTA